MAIPQSKRELLDAIESTFELLMRDLARVPAQYAMERSMEGHVSGTQMSPANLVAYLIGWNRLALKWLIRDDRGETVTFPETGFKWTELGALAQRFYADHADLSWGASLAELQAAKADLVAALAARSDAELYGQPWHGKHTKGRMIQLNTSSPYKNARTRIRAWLRTIESD
ncbi:MAG: ClbS/DfsB family four-helix bundle protein [Pseudomonadota bacterium]